MSNTSLTTVANGGDGFRPPRLPRWTRQEILVLIQGKRVVESRGRVRASTSAGAGAVEPKWAAVSAYCRRHGVTRGALQCRKRWSNLAGDFKKIKEWEIGRAAPGLAESFWAMRNDLRRERKLPGFFDRDVYDILNGASTVAAPAEETAETTSRGVEGAGDVVVFDSGRSAAEDGLFSDFEDGKEAEEEVDSDLERPASPVEVVPISEKRPEPFQGDGFNPGPANPSKDNHQPAADNSCKNSPERGTKRRRTSQEEVEDSSSFQSQLIEMLDRNSRILAAQLQTQNFNTQLDREQRQDQVNGLLGVLNKLADALSRIADKL